MLPVVNETFTATPPNLGADQNEGVRADLSSFETQSGGAVYTTGSIAWCGALPWNGYDNSLSRMTRDAPQRFMQLTPFG